MGQATRRRFAMVVLAVVASLAAAETVSSKKWSSTTVDPGRPAGAVLTVPAAPAQPRWAGEGDDADIVVTEIRPDTLKELCAEHGYEPEDAKDTAGDPSLVLKMGDYKVALLLYGKQTYVNLGLQATFEKNEAPDPQVMNEWNHTKRYSRAYANGARGVLEADLDLQGGVTLRSITRFLARFKLQVVDFAKEIGFTKG